MFGKYAMCTEIEGAKMYFYVYLATLHMRCQDDNSFVQTDEYKNVPSNLVC